MFVKIMFNLFKCSIAHIFSVFVRIFHGLDFKKNCLGASEKLFYEQMQLCTFIFYIDCQLNCNSIGGSCGDLIAKTSWRTFLMGLSLCHFSYFHNLNTIFCSVWFYKFMQNESPTCIFAGLYRQYIAI